MPIARKVLGIDPGTHQFGIGCIEKHANRYRVIFVETIKAPSKESLYPRLKKIQTRLHELLEACRPDEAVIEDLFHARNARSAFHLGLARGIAVAACLQRHIPIFEYSPSKIKSVVTGHGRADKEQVKRMTELQLGIQLNVGYDASDALAAALCHTVNISLQLGTKATVS